MSLRFALVAALGLLLLLTFPVATAQESGSQDTDASEPVDTEPVDVETTTFEDSEPAATDTEPADTEPADTEPADTEPTDTEPADTDTTAKPKVVVGKIDADIGLAESAYIKRLAEEGERLGADTLAIELNTFGGRVDAAVAIRDTLMDTELHTVVFINRRAISAGALISLACDSIAIAGGGTIGAATPVTQAPGQEVAEAVGEKYVSYFREEMRATAESNDRDGDIAEAMVDAEKEIEGISAAGKLLTLNTRTAIEHGIADVEAKDLDDALAQLGLSGEQLNLDPSWSEALVAFLTSQAIASILGLIMIVCAYLEYQTPGVGIFGGIAALCFFLLYFGHFMVNLAGWEELLLFGLGIALILVEIFVTPGFGFIGMTGVGAILTSFVMLLMAGDWSDLTFSNPFTGDAILQVMLTMVIATAAFFVMVRFMPRDNSAIGGRLVLQTELAVAEGVQSFEAVEESLVGERGKTTTPLRPSGKMQLEGKRLNVETEGEFVEKGCEVEILRHQEGRIVVRAV